MTIREPLLGSLNQGSLFCCAKAERYSGCQVHGVVLTARCDLDQDKYNVLNYAPVVTLEDWLRRDGYELIVARIAADLKSRIDSAVKNIDLPLSILHSQNPKSILEIYIRAVDADPKRKKSEDKFVDLVNKTEDLARWRTGWSPNNCDMFATSEQTVTKVIAELIHQKLAGYYFLSRLEVGADETGFVVLLREVNHLPRPLALLIAGGMEAEHEELMAHKEWLANVDFKHADFAMPVSEITSPSVEHLLQTFSHLFGRIGLPDPQKTLVDSLCGVRPLAIEVKQ